MHRDIVILSLTLKGCPPFPFVLGRWLPFPKLKKEQKAAKENLSSHENVSLTQDRDQSSASSRGRRWQALKQAAGPHGSEVLSLVGRV